MNQVRGTIHGKFIELNEETGLPDGQEVTVFVQPVAGTTEEQPLPPGEGLRRAFGAWAEDVKKLANRNSSGEPSDRRDLENCPQ